MADDDAHLQQHTDGGLGWPGGAVRAGLRYVGLRWLPMRVFGLSGLGSTQAAVATGVAHEDNSLTGSTAPHCPL
ncbi:hypothetical protein C8Q79DRAFT_942617 [Trametes meyenii]|nr:hypothetical protein C8Q79DRAFT_942617 [Trametes meyenii]